MEWKEEDHPRAKDGKFTDRLGGSVHVSSGEIKKFKQNTSYDEILAADFSETIALPDETLPRSLGAKWINENIRMPDGTSAHFVEGSKLHHKEVFAGKGTRTPIRDVYRLVKTYGGKAENWQKIKAIGMLEQYGKSFEAEIHWYQEPSVGKKEIKFKEENL